MRLRLLPHYFCHRHYTNQHTRSFASDSAMSPDTIIRYFSYGAMVNSVSRSRRKLASVNERPAMLPNYKVVFTNGTGDVVAQEDETVHGLLMEFHREEDWEVIKNFESGYEVCEANVIPYSRGEDGSINEQEPVQARFFHFDGNAVGKALPTERYLRIIAMGLEEHGVDPQYVNWLQAQPCVPSVKPEDYLVMEKAEGELPTISTEEYMQRAKAENLFVLSRNKVGQLQTFDAAFSKWIISNAIGKPPCLGWTLYNLLYEPNLPHCETAADLTDAHHQFAEHEFCLYSKTGKCKVSHVMNLET